MSIELEMVFWWVGIAFIAGIVIGLIIRKATDDIKLTRAYHKGIEEGRFQAALTQPAEPYPTHKPAFLMYQELRGKK